MNFFNAAFITNVWPKVRRSLKSGVVSGAAFIRDGALIRGNVVIIK